MKRDKATDPYRLLIRGLAGDIESANLFNQSKVASGSFKVFLNILSKYDLSNCPADILFPLERQLRARPIRNISAFIENLARSADSVATQAILVILLVNKIAEHDDCKNHFKNAKCYLEKKAKEDDPLAIYALGRIEKDKEQAFILFQKSADLGNFMAMNAVGICFEKGWGVKEDISKAIECYERAAEQRDTEAMVSLTNLYQPDKAIIVKKDIWNILSQIGTRLEQAGKARDCQIAAAKLGNPRAIKSLENTGPIRLKNLIRAAHLGDCQAVVLLATESFSSICKSSLDSINFDIYYDDAMKAIYGAIDSGFTHRSLQAYILLEQLINKLNPITLKACIEIAKEEYSSDENPVELLVTRATIFRRIPEKEIDRVTHTREIKTCLMSIFAVNNFRFNYLLTKTIIEKMSSKIKVPWFKFIIFLGEPLLLIAAFRFLCNQDILSNICTYTMTIKKIASDQLTSSTFGRLFKAITRKKVHASYLQKLPEELLAKVGMFCVDRDTREDNSFSYNDRYLTAQKALHLITNEGAPTNSPISS